MTERPLGMSQEQYDALPFLCDNCGTRYGYGGMERLLSVVKSVQFDEALPCCGKPIKGVATLGTDGYPVIELDH